ncbi:MAG: hypothetical protein H6720_11945 [Sandaracinus sp.]|nr:hypothetical protein [Sandaracinus sp.]
MLSQTQNVAAMVASYTNTARFSSRHCILLAHQLVRVAPTKLDKPQQAALDLVMVRAQEVEEVRKARQRVSPPALRGARMAVVTAWGAVHGALSALSTVPSEVAPIGEQASTLLVALFPEGNPGMIALDAGAVWTQSHTLFARIDEESLRARIDALVAPALLQTCERAFRRLGDAVGVTGELKPSTPKTALREANARFAFAVSAYARALSIGLDETDEVALARFQSALAPIDGLRITGRAADALDEDEEDDEPSTPADPVDDPDAPYVPASDDPIDNPFIT